MTTNLEKSFDIPAPVQEVFDQWASFSEYPQFMPHVQQVRAIEDKRWIWETVDQHWQVEITEQTPQTSLSWRITAPDYTCDATIRFEPLEGDAGTKVIYTAHYPNGFGLQHTAASTANDMQTALEQSAAFFTGEGSAYGSEDSQDEFSGASQDESAEDAEGLPMPTVDDVLMPMNTASAALQGATQALDDDLPHIVESTETLQRTLTEATQAWTASVTKAFESFNALLWSPVKTLRDSGQSVRTWSPRFEFTRGDGMLFVSSELPGYGPEDLHVEIVDGELLISGERQATQASEGATSGDGQAEAATQTARERFEQRMPLTQAVEAKRVEAQVTPSGQLRIALPLKREDFAEAEA